MSNLGNLKIWCSPITHTIYAGYTNKNGQTAKAKIDVTKQVIDAVMMHLAVSGEEYECAAGDLVFKPKGGDTIGTHDCSGIPSTDNKTETP